MVGLLKPPSGVTPLVKADYVDVLGDHDAIGPHREQQIFSKKFLTHIYERFWRPVVTRILFGLRGPTAEEEKRLTVGMLELSPGDRIIDVGCGPGNYTRYMADAVAGGLVVGIDASDAMVAAAAQRSGRANAAYLRGDACALPFEDGTFDAACSAGVIHLLEEPMRALDEIVRVLTPGGRLALFVTCAKGDEARQSRGGMTYFGRDEVPDALRKHGLLDVNQRVFRRGQFISARKPAEVAVDR
jgi:SAM-dependent methyltransferase